MASNSSDKDLRADAKNFCESLGNVFMMKRRDPQTQHLLEKAKSLIELLIAEKRVKSERPPIMPKPSTRGGSGMGQLWVKMEELKRENEDLKRRTHTKKEEKSSPGKSSGPGEVIIGELHKTRQENDAVKAELVKSQTLVKELEKINVTLQDEFKRAKISQETAQGALERIRKEHKHLETSLDSVKTENDTLKRRFTQSVKPMVRLDTKHVENINEKCRPSNIALSYNNLESQGWVDAKEMLEDMGHEDEETVIRFLCEIVMIAYDCSLELLTEMEATIAKVFPDPNKINSSIQGGNTAQNVKPLGDELMISIKDFLRQNFDDIDPGIVVDNIKDRLFKNDNWGEFKEVASYKIALAGYIEQCTRITWQMVIQQTPMYLSTSDTQFDDEVHKLWWSCSQSKAQLINYFVWPSLHDFKNGSLMVKGCVHAS